MRVRFLRPYDYHPSIVTRGVPTIAYRAGWQGTVKRECGEAAIKAGAAEEIVEPAPDAEATKPA